MLKKENKDTKREVLEMKKKLECIERINRANNVIVRELKMDIVVESELRERIKNFLGNFGESSSGCWGKNGLQVRFTYMFSKSGKCKK